MQSKTINGVEYWVEKGRYFKKHSGKVRLHGQAKERVIEAGKKQAQMKEAGQFLDRLHDVCRD